ncbi:hypothetical protein ABPG72_015263 [Tetrahymena utriculariae]
MQDQKDFEQKAKQYLKNQGYTVQQLLGKGSFGRVYKAHDFNNNKSVAIKVIKLKSELNEDINKTIQEILNCQKPNSEYVVKIDKVLVDVKITKLIYIIQEYCSKAKELRKEKGHSYTSVQGFSPLYAAPEVNFENQISYYSDFYSVGAVFCILCDLSFQDLQGIQVKKMPNIENKTYKNLLILALNMMAYEPKKRASCQRILNILENQNDLDTKESKKQIQQMTTECNEEALCLLNKNQKQQKLQETQNQQSQSQPLPCRKPYFLFWILWSIIPFAMIGISIYYITKSCLNDLLTVLIILSVFVSYFSFSSYYLEKINQKRLRIHWILEISTILIYSTILYVAYKYLTGPFPCDDLYICTDWFDIRYKMTFNNNNENEKDIQLDRNCQLIEPDRKEMMEQYFQSKYNQNMTINYYENSFGYLPYCYLGSAITMGVWILFRMFSTFFCRCFKCCKK